MLFKIILLTKQILNISKVKLLFFFLAACRIFLETQDSSKNNAARWFWAPLGWQKEKVRTGSSVLAPPGSLLLQAWARHPVTKPASSSVMFMLEFCHVSDSMTFQLGLPGTVRTWWHLLKVMLWKECFLGLCPVGFSGSSLWQQDPPTFYTPQCPHNTHRGALIWEVMGDGEVGRQDGGMWEWMCHDHSGATPPSWSQDFLPQPPPKPAVLRAPGKTTSKAWVWTPPPMKEFQPEDSTKEMSALQLGSSSGPPSY